MLTVSTMPDPPPSGSRDNESALSCAFSCLGFRRPSDRHGPVTQPYDSSGLGASRADYPLPLLTTVTPLLPRIPTLVAVPTPTPQSSVYLDASPIHLPAALLFKSDPSFKPDPDGSPLECPDGSCLEYPTPDPNFITTVYGAATGSISLPPSGNPSLASQVVNLRLHLAAAEEQAFGNVSSVTPNPSSLSAPWPLLAHASSGPLGNDTTLLPDDGASISTDDVNPAFSSLPHGTPSLWNNLDPCPMSVLLWTTSDVPPPRTHVLQLELQPTCSPHLATVHNMSHMVGGGGNVVKTYPLAWALQMHFIFAGRSCLTTAHLHHA
jgi:hypothetical protein